MGRKSNVLIRLFKEVPGLLREPRFLEEDTTPRKCLLQRWAELTWYAVLDRRTMFEYNAAGCDRRGSPVSEMIRFWRDWKQCIVRPNRRYLVDWTAPLGDKFLFAAYCKAADIRHVPVFARMEGTGICQIQGARKSIEELLSYLRVLDAFVAKPADDCGGHGVVIVKDPRSFSLSMLEPNRDYVFQPRIEQHPAMAELNQTTVNTLRILTCRDAAKSKFAQLGCSVVRIGRVDSDVDNAAQGGIVCGCDEKGRLTKIAFCISRDEVYTRVRIHPDHGYAFDGQQIPFYREAVDLCLKAHRHFRHVWVVGWDVAITADGPVLIEGNSAPGIEGQQIAGQEGLRPQLRKIGLLR